MSSSLRSSRLVFCIGMLAGLLSSGCSHLGIGYGSIPKPVTTPLIIDSDSVAVTPNVIGRPAPLPDGVRNYCWEEPMAIDEANGPGLDTEGKWYHRSYLAIREVRGGKWRPCERESSEIDGRTKENERSQ